MNKHDKLPSEVYIYYTRKALICQLIKESLKNAEEVKLLYDHVFLAKNTFDTKG